jgi:phosphoribosyl 1,2-cyclic phosphate phosphodiesterase
MVEVDGQTLVIDTGPDFRQQMLRANPDDVNAVLFTHEHKDHVAGLDDIRPFNFKQKRPLDVYATQAVQVALKREFHYIFSADQYPGVPQVVLHTIDHRTPFHVNGTTVIPIKVMHYKLPVLGFRIGDMAYVTDAKTISEEEKQKLKNLEVLVVNALRIQPHISHFNLQEALDLVVELKPQHTFLTHISHLLGAHDAVSESLPDGVYLAYDGLQVEC